VLAVVLGIAVFIALANWMVDSPAVSFERLRQMKSGMNKAEVIDLLGKPRWQKKESNGRKSGHTETRSSGTDWKLSGLRKALCKLGFMTIEAIDTGFPLSRE
jgi:hypothetical protein